MANDKKSVTSGLNCRCTVMIVMLGFLEPSLACRLNASAVSTPALCGPSGYGGYTQHGTSRGRC